MTKQERAAERRRERYASDPSYAESRRQAAREYRAAHLEHVKAKKSEWQRQHLSEARAAAARSKERHPQQHHARWIVRGAIRQGRLVPEPCWCGEVKVDAHHHKGYAEAHLLDVVWLCRKHHAEQHRRCLGAAA